MTVHGAKGLQSPVVILADACADPDRAGGGVRLAALDLGEGLTVPAFRPRTEELADPPTSWIQEQERPIGRTLAAALRGDDLRRTALRRRGIGRARSQRAPHASWYRAVENALGGPAPIGTMSRPGPGIALDSSRNWQEPAETSEREGFVPDWLRAPAPVEAPAAAARRPRSARTAGRSARRAELRGGAARQIAPRSVRTAAGRRNGRARDAALSAAPFRRRRRRSRARPLTDDACRVIDDPRFADLFGADRWRGDRRWWRTATSSAGTVDWLYPGRGCWSPTSRLRGGRRRGSPTFRPPIHRWRLSRRFGVIFPIGRSSGFALHRRPDPARCRMICSRPSAGGG